MDARREQQDRENKDRNTDRDKDRNSRSSLENAASDLSNDADLSGNDNSFEEECGDRVPDSELVGELDSANQADKKNKNVNSRSNKSRRRDETKSNDDKVNKIGEDISSVEAAE